jgi:NAD(P)-dependent dehydrogenase (short-subunit alcohol dehydrogenase family)
MAKSFCLLPDVHSQPEGKRRSILVTGAAGRLGTAFSERAPDHYSLRLMVRPGQAHGMLASRGEVVECELEDLEGLKQQCQGIDTIVHLAAEASPATTWAKLLPTNIVGTYNVFAAAKAAGCRRVVFASSIHAVSGYPTDVQVQTSDPVNPGDLYGVSKAFGEALGRYMAEQEGVSCVVIRIGAATTPEWFSHPQRGLSMVDAFLSYDDFQQLLERSIDDERIRFAIVHGLSDNRFKRLDLSTTRTLLGYAPKDDASRLVPELRDVEINLAHHSFADGFPSGLREDI